MGSASGTIPASELGHDPILELPVGDVGPSPENNQLYRPVDPDDPEIIALAESIAVRGVQEPLIITEDGWIISGHRRYVAAQLAGLETVPCRVKSISKDESHDEFMALLRECNRQRDKSLDEKLREEVVSSSPEEAYESLLEYRRRRAKVDIRPMQLRGQKRRAKITDAKSPMLDAIRKILNERREFLPLSVRQIHYALLNDPPLIHASKPKSGYRNLQKCYKALDELLTRARVAGIIPMDVIADDTRPVVASNGYRDCRAFLRRELDLFLKGYWRDLMQSQPNHIEIMGEKNTIAPIVQPIAEEYCIPMTTGRGYCSVPPRYQMARRFENSGKEKLVVLLMSDLDPDGEEIAHSFARSMRDDFGVEQIVPVKVAMTGGQVEQHNLPPRLKAKESSSNYKKFVARHGHNVFELEALPPRVLQEALRDAIESVIDRDLFDGEIATEKQESRFLEDARRRVRAVMAGQIDSEVGRD